MKLGFDWLWNIDGDVIYILDWIANPFTFGEMEQTVFEKRKCEYQNCFVTNDRNINNIHRFDVITVYAMLLFMYGPIEMPDIRSENQIYVLYSDEPAATYPLTPNFDDVFNLTWTYKLDSDAYYGYVIIKDNGGNVIGPKTSMNWIDIEDMKNTSEQVLERLKNKSTAVAWFSSHCEVQSQRGVYVMELMTNLTAKGHVLDIYGKCGQLSCPKDSTNCSRLVGDYYFYLAFENSFSDDYVTEKLLTAIKNYAVPIVYGGANYTRFMPEGIYLDASKIEPANMSAKIDHLINHREEYNAMFKWHNHYSYHNVKDSPKTDPVCDLCRVVNDFVKMNKTSMYTDMCNWFNEPFDGRNLPPKTVI